MLFKPLDFISEKQKQLSDLQDKSYSALDVVTNTINDLSNVNEEIDSVIHEIAEAKAKLVTTEDRLNETKIKNGRIISKFRSLIEE